METFKIELEFIVANAALTASEVAALKVGSVVDLGPTPPLLRIVAHETLLGEGRLIERDGRLVAEITGWGQS